MKAVVMSGVGGPEVLKLTDLPEPVLQGENQVRVRLKAAGINPVDTKLRSKGTYFPEHSPTILGCDGAGVIDAVGKAVQHFKIGDAVYFCHGGIGGPDGNYAEYVTVDERWVAHKPNALSFVEAAAAPLVLITAWESLFDRADVQTGQHVLIHAGAGGVGHVAIQLAKITGAHVATTVGNEEKANFVKRIGADEPIFYKETPFADAVLKFSHGQGVDMALDTVGFRTFQETFPAVRVYGDLVTLLQPGPEIDWRIARLRNLRISLELMLAPMYLGLAEYEHHQADILARCARLFDEGQLRMEIAEVLPLREAAAAHRLLEQGSRPGKIVLQIED